MADASAQGEVTAGGTIHIVGGISDEGVDGIETFYNRIVVEYSNTLENGLEIDGRVAIFTSDAPVRFYNPGESFVTVGGGFGTVAMGNHVTAVHATLPFPLMTPDSPHWGHHGMFAGVAPANGPALWSFFGWTPNNISYQTPEIGGLKAMVTYAPHSGAYQNNQVAGAMGAAADPTSADDYIAAAVRYESNMGGMEIAVGAGIQTAKDDMVDSVAMSGTVGMGGITVGAAWHDNGESTTGGGGTEGFMVSAKYTLGQISPSIAYGQAERAMDGREENYLVIGGNYDVGGGFSVSGEYIALEVGDEDDTVLMGGVVLSF